ncbi:MAG: hypothetical protein M1818_006985 [Claussenomyces sp. TS43310]|nr:MAG: hypothetical protein M1818_006985 [Claussenomyces sp. TS43310]
MSTRQLQSTVVSTPRSSHAIVPARIPDSVPDKSEPRMEDTRNIVIVYGEGQEKIVSVFADVLGKPYTLSSSFITSTQEADSGTVFGVGAFDAKLAIREINRTKWIAINAYCVDLGVPPDSDLSAQCDYEFLYTAAPFFRRDLSRFVSFILGQISHHEALTLKPRTFFISTTFADVRTALSNLDILSVGSDAVEIRVDLLKELLPDGTSSPVPSLSYVGEQVMLLRQRTELPIIFTTRCTRENGRFPMENPQLYYDYLYRAIQWGCEYIDVELWLPEHIRRRLYEQRGNSRIISAFHDFSGKFKWPSTEAQRIFQESRKYGDIVKMITVINDVSENYELEYFRSQIKARNPDGPPLSAVNMGQLGQVSRALNTVFSPITHPLLPIVAAPGQMSAAEINGALSTLGQLPKRTIYAIGKYTSTPQTTFFEKCFNELGLPHQVVSVDRRPGGTVEALCLQPNFGGAYVSPPLPASQPYIPVSTDSARTIGAIDTIVVRSDGTSNTLVGDNATWKGIRATLTRDFAPSAFKHRFAIILSSSNQDAASAIFALRSLDIRKIYTVGFKVQGQLGHDVEPFTSSIESMQRIDQPIVIISALLPARSHLVQPLLRHFGSAKANSKTSGKIFVDLANGPKKGDPLAVAEASGWTAYGVADTSAFTTPAAEASFKAAAFDGFDEEEEEEEEEKEEEERSSVIDYDQPVRLARSSNVLAYMVGHIHTQASPRNAHHRIDAVPKKRGPKTDLLEALLKRVDGLEKRLKDEEKPHISPTDGLPSTDGDTLKDDNRCPRLTLNSTIESPGDGPAVSQCPPPFQHHVLFDMYFKRVHGKPYYILDENVTRQNLAGNRIPEHLLNAIYAISSRYVTDSKDYHAAANLSEDYASRARAELEADEPSIEGIQTLLLLSLAFMAAGKGRKAYMLLATAIGMALALELHRELHIDIRVTASEREMRRRLFWTCYILDRFTACGSKRPSLISDKSVFLRLPSWSPSQAVLPVEGEFFRNGSNLQYHSPSGRKNQGGDGMLIDIVRILGNTNRYLAAGGVKGDSHFPWHSSSNLSKIRRDLGIWELGKEELSAPIDALFGHPDKPALVLSKLIYHLIHCLLYRPFLPIDLVELAGTGQPQSWQKEATNLCFLHANAIAELVELGERSGSMEWPALVGYCICTAGTVHVHGAHYRDGQVGEAFSDSAEFLSRETQQLTDLRGVWASIEREREMLQTVYTCHSDLVKSLASNTMRYSPVSHFEDFFDRYSTLGPSFDGAHVAFTDVAMEPIQHGHAGLDSYGPGIGNSIYYPPEGAAEHESGSTAARAVVVGISQSSRQGENPFVVPPEMLSDPLHSGHIPVLQHNFVPTPASLPLFGGRDVASLPTTPFSPRYDFTSVGLSQPPVSFDPTLGIPMAAQVNNFSFDADQGMTPGGLSNNESAGNRGEEEKDPFLSLLEQLAENEYTADGPSELEFFLGQGQ